ncbi:MAG TPA: YceI family protein, partial [Gemmatimonadales bacterium]|nr:YceI family protein [Gemmatimonadales bacterium]
MSTTTPASTGSPAAAPAPAVSTWTIDPAHTEAGFSVKHLMISTVRGRFGEVAGTIRLDEDDLSRSSVEVELDAATIDTRSEQR